MKIADIQDILRFYKRFQLRKTEAFDLIGWEGSASKMGLFFKAVSKSKATATDQDIYAEVYGKGVPDAKYHFLKSHCTNLLLDQFLREHIDKRIDSAITRGAYIAQKQYVITILLSRLGSKKAARTMTAKTLRMCQRYQLTSLSIDLLEELRHYAFLEGQIRLFKKYSLEIARSVDLLQAELEMKKLDQSIRVHLSKSFVPTPALRVLLRNIVTNARRISQQHQDNYAIQVTYFRIQYMACQTQGKIAASIEACTSAINYIILREDFSSRNRIGEFAIYLLENNILIEDRNGGAHSIELCERYVARGSNLWFKYQEYHFLFALHTDQIEMAAAVLREVLAHPRLAVQIDHLKERWHIFTLILHYREWVSQKESSKSDKPVPSLLRSKNYREMLKSYPVYVKDKRGFNVSLLILNILLLLESGRIDEIIEQIEALATYRNKYLRSKEVSQSAVLFKFFRIMVNANFSYTKILQRMKANDSFSQLSLKTTSEVTEGLQILPCAWVIDRVLYLLKKQ